MTAQYYPAESPTPRKTLASHYPLWHIEAKCLGKEDTIFFGASDPETRPPYTLSDIRKAQDICAECPVAKMCLTEALENREDYGVWAGTTSKQRKTMLAEVSAGTSIEEVVTVYLRRVSRSRTISKASPGSSTATVVAALR